ncbi:MAG: hypothetical protein QNJ40_00850 [Xanthomonadales bacterium]|nr:hypothetical protein [Xanthomonadales bacterium]
MNRRTTILASLLLMLSTSVNGQIYAFHSDIQGVYWNPSLAGWGFAFDVQKGILFGAVYGYDNQGEPVFYTLISEKADGNAGLTFQGDAFLTRENGSATSDVGQFTLQFGRTGGQPALAINMETPSLTLEDFPLIRFAYAEVGSLGMLSGAEVRTWYGQAGDSQNQNGTSWSIGNTRTQVEGRETLDVLNDQGETGFAALVETPTITTYVIFFPINDSQALTYDFDLANARGGQGLRVVIDNQGTPVGDLETFASAVVQVDEASNKAGVNPVPVARRSEILTAFERYLELNGK